MPKSFLPHDAPPAAPEIGFPKIDKQLVKTEPPSILPPGSATWNPPALALAD